MTRSCGGQNTCGELALGDTADRNKPTRVEFDSNVNGQTAVADVACGNELTSFLFGAFALLQFWLLLSEH